MRSGLLSLALRPGSPGGPLRLAPSGRGAHSLPRLPAPPLARVQLAAQWEAANDAGRGPEPFFARPFLIKEAELLKPGEKSRLQPLENQVRLLACSPASLLAC